MSARTSRPGNLDGGLPTDGAKVPVAGLAGEPGEVDEAKILDLARQQGYDLGWQADYRPFLERRPPEERLEGFLAGMRLAEEMGNINCWASSLNRHAEIALLKSGKHPEGLAQYLASCHSLLSAMRHETIHGVGSLRQEQYPARLNPKSDIDWNLMSLD